MLGRLPEARPDVLLLDIGLPGMSGIDGARRAREMLSTLPILMLTVHEDNELVLEALCAGACGYLVKKTLPGTRAAYHVCSTRVELGLPGFSGHLEKPIMGAEVLNGRSAPEVQAGVQVGSGSDGG